MNKILSRQEVATLREELRARGQKVGFTSGVFDLIHPGHVEYLEKAKALCDVLFVGLNSDSSVKEYKDPLRPINGESNRAIVLAGLQSVNYLFIFNERNNNKNIELLKPDLYIKAGDYSKEKLTSAPAVEAYGGRVELIPVHAGASTTNTIAEIISRYSVPECTELPLPPPSPAVFLDRDGTIIEHVEYIHEPEKVKLLPGALAGMKRLKEAGFRLVVVTNQPGIGMGYFTKEDFFAVNREFLRAVVREKIFIDKVYFCPHSESQKCTCRKPSTGMIERAVKELNINLTQSFMIGDMTLDVMLGKNAGCRTIQVVTGIGGNDKRFEVVPDFTAKNLDEAATWILAQPAPKKI